MNKNKKNSYDILSQGLMKLKKAKTTDSVSAKKNTGQEIIEIKEKSSQPGKELAKKCAKEKDPNLPDRSYGDYYCTICDSHMNSEEMWVDHVSGKRHQKNLKKGDKESKYEELDIESNINQDLKNVKDPVVGLSYIQEVRRKESDVPPFYSCFLCHATISTVPLVIEHILSMKHRQNYIRENAPAEFELLVATDLKKDLLEPLVQETAQKLEQKLGRGEVLVKQEKPKKFIPLKRAHLSDDEEDSYHQRPVKDDSHHQRPVKDDSYHQRPVKDDSYHQRPVKDDSYHQRPVKDDSYHQRPVKDDSYHQRPVKDIKSGMTKPYLWKSVDSSRALGDKKENFREDTIRSDPYYSKEHSEKYFPERSISRDDKYISPEFYSSSYEKGFQRDNYQRQPEYNDDYLRQADLHKKPYSSSDEFRRPHFQEPLEKSYNPTRIRSEEYYSPHPTGPSGSNLLPHELINTNEMKNFTDASFLKGFLEKVLELPTEVLLKIFLVKMDNMDIKKTEELSLLSKIIVKAQDVLHTNLPSELQDLMQQRFQSSTASTASSFTSSISSTLRGSALMTPSSLDASNIETHIPKRQEPQSAMNYIKDLLKSVRDANPSTPSTVSHTAPTHHYANPSTPSTVTHTAPTHHYANSLPSVNQSAPIQQYQNAQQNSRTFTPSFNSYSSVASQSTSFETYSYSNSQSNLSSAIPGFSREENKNPEPQPYNNYQTVNSPNPPYEMKNYYRY